MSVRMLVDRLASCPVCISTSHPKFQCERERETEGPASFPSVPVKETIKTFQSIYTEKAEQGLMYYSELISNVTLERL